MENRLLALGIVLLMVGVLLAGCTEQDIQGVTSSSNDLTKDNETCGGSGCTWNEIGSCSDPDSKCGENEINAKWVCEGGSSCPDHGHEQCLPRC